MQRRTRSNSSELAILVQRAASVGRGLKDVQGDEHCGMHAIVDQLQQQGFLVKLQSVREDTAAWLSDKEYAWSQFPQDDARTWTTFVEQVGHTGTNGFWVNHTVFAGIACRYNCDITIIQSMPDDTNAFVLLSGKDLAMSLTDKHYEETKQWRDLNVTGVVDPLFLAQKGLQHIVSTELLSTPKNIPPLEVSQLQVQVVVVLVPQACQAGHPQVCLPLRIYLLRQEEMGVGLQQPWHRPRVKRA